MAGKGPRGIPDDHRLQSSRPAPRALSPAMTWRGVLVGFGRVVAGIVIGVAIFLAFSAIMSIQLVTLPAVTGPENVGRVALALEDAGRVDPFATDGRARELSVWIWYPAGDAGGDPAPYLSSGWASALNTLGPLSQDLTAVRTHSIADASLAGQPSVVVLLPGLGQPIAGYSSFAEDLASQGYAVVGINPTESVVVEFPDGHIVPATSLGGVMETNIDDWYVSAERVTNVWADDAQFVVDSLAAGPPAIGPLDFAHVAYVGHSLGGAAAVEACSQDPECAGAIDLDGTLWTEVRHTGLAAPTLLIHHDSSVACDQFCERARVDFATVGASPNVEDLALGGSEHNNFSDLGLMWGPGTFQLDRSNPDRVINITRDLVRSFLEVHVRGASASTFSDAVSRYPEVSDISH
jgi:pimeloyl-ACP methyl ester carboxylesterase